MNHAITLKQLRYLVAVADARHFGQAPAACHISQPSLSAPIQQLEETIGARLFERSKLRLVPTPLGEAVAERARKVMAEVVQPDRNSGEKGKRVTVLVDRGCLRGLKHKKTPT